MTEECEANYCEICARNGKISKIKVYQINFEEATKICENEDCTYPFGLRSSSGAIINRKYTDIANLKRNKETISLPQRVLKKSIPGPRTVHQRPALPQLVKSTVPSKILAPYIPGRSSPLERKTVEFQKSPFVEAQKNNTIINKPEDDVKNQALHLRESDNKEIGHDNNSDLLKDDKLLKSLHLTDNVIYPQWQNKDALCWLDVVMCLFVHNQRLQRFVATETHISSSVLVTLVKAYRQALSLFNSPQTIQSKFNQGQDDQKSKLIEQTSHETMEMDIGSPKPRISVCKEVIGDFKRLSVDEDGVKTGAGFQLINSDFLSIMATVGETKYSRGLEILQNVRESTWKSIQPKLRCKKGQNDSPVFAIPLLTKDNKYVEKLFNMSYSFKLKCSHCGHTKTDHYDKVLPTFPNTNRDFCMSAPAFVRPCFQCETPNQRRVMVYERLSDIVMLHFVEGLPHNDFEKLSFRYQGNLYAVTGLIQYRNDPDHFVAWLRDPHENLWMECDDLKSPVTSYLATKPDLPANQIHIVMWELQSFMSVGRPIDLKTGNMLNSLAQINTISQSGSVNHSDVGMEELASNSQSNVSMDKRNSGAMDTGATCQQIMHEPKNSLLMVTLTPSGHLVPVPPQGVGGTPSVCPISLLPQAAGNINFTNTIAQGNVLSSGLSNHNMNLGKQVLYRRSDVLGQSKAITSSELIMPSLGSTLNVFKSKKAAERTVITHGYTSQVKSANPTSMREQLISKTKSNVSFLRSIKQKRAKQGLVVASTNSEKSFSPVACETSNSNRVSGYQSNQLKSSASESSFLSRFSFSHLQVSSGSAFNLKGKVFEGYKSKSTEEETSRASSPVSDCSSRCSSPALSTSSDGVVVQKRKTEVSAKLSRPKRRKSALLDQNCTNAPGADDSSSLMEDSDDSNLNSECLILQGLYSALNIPLPDKTSSGSICDSEGQDNLACDDMPDVLELAQYIDTEENSSPNIEGFLSQLL